MAKYLVLNGKRISKAQMCNILNTYCCSKRCYFPATHDYKDMVFVFLLRMNSLDAITLQRAVGRFYNLWLADDVLGAFRDDIDLYYNKLGYYDE